MIKNPTAFEPLAIPLQRDPEDFEGDDDYIYDEEGDDDE